MEMLKFEEILFSKDHIWLKKIDSNSYYLGITDFAQDLLGDIVFADILLDKQVVSGSALGIIESVKTSSDIISPSDAVVIEINPVLKNAIEQVNEKPYETWLCKIATIKGEEIPYLVNHDDYQALIKN